MHLARFPRVRLAHLPTPLEPLERLSAALGGPDIWIKRDDCTGLSTGGNKTRKLEVPDGGRAGARRGHRRHPGRDAVEPRPPDRGLRRQSSASTATFLLEDRTGFRDPDYTANGNVLLDRLHGATVEHRPGGVDMNAELQKAAARLSAEGRRPYAIPGGGSNPIGALGYVDAAQELMCQADMMGLALDRIVTATGSAGTQAGLIVGLKGVNAQVPLLGIGVRAPKPKQEENVFALACATADLLGVPGIVDREDVVANTDYVGGGYGIPTPGMIEAVEMFARLEGLLLDPVYSGKGAAGLIDLARKGFFAKGETVVFLHTGGSVGLFGYTGAFDAPRENAA